MSFRRELILLLCYIILAEAKQTRIEVDCDEIGFTCTYVGSKRLVTYQCTSTTQDIIAHLWNFGEPSNAAWVVIRNCENVEIDMGCSSCRRYFESLTIENVTNLQFTRITNFVKNPTKMIIKKVKNIEVIPEDIFSIPRTVRHNGDASQHELQEIHFEDVHIGTIEGRAFNNLRGFREFTWNNVRVDRLHANAIKINFNTTEKYQGKFNMLASSVEILEYLSFQLYAKKASFIKSKFVEIMPGGINGTVENFEFLSNVVNTLQSGSISILSKNMSIIGNTFDYLKPGSLENISPGLLVDSHTSFGNLEFLFTFKNNNIIYMDAGSLNPDMRAYKRVSTNFQFHSNSFLCSCENMGWLMSPLGHGYSTSYLRDFYETITNKQNSNICSGLTYKMMLGEVQHFLKSGKCHPNITMEYFCRPTTPPPPPPPASIANKYDADELVWFNRSDRIVSATGHHCSSSFSLIQMAIGVSLIANILL